MKRVTKRNFRQTNNGANQMFKKVNLTLLFVNHFCYIFIFAEGKMPVMSSMYQQEHGIHDSEGPQLKQMLGIELKLIFFFLKL